MKLKEIAEKLELRSITKQPSEDDVTGVYISDMLSDVIANAKAGNVLITIQVHANVIAAANLVDIPGIIVAQGKEPAEEVVKLAEKNRIALYATGLNRWQVATKLYEVGVR
jgi:hypothetical protein